MICLVVCNIPVCNYRYNNDLTDNFLTTNMLIVYVENRGDLHIHKHGKIQKHSLRLRVSCTTPVIT